MKDLKLSIEISRELASSVLGLNVVYTESCEHRDGIIGIWTDINTKPIEEISIYEFAFKCKEWLLKNNIAFTLNYYNDNSVQFYCEKYHLDIESSSEIEKIIKACNWILEETNDNKNI